jgi:hypothetical protein
MWQTEQGVLFQTRAQERDVIVLAGARALLD